MDNEIRTEDLFDLINFNGEEGDSTLNKSLQKPSKPPRVTFMEPNIGTLYDYPINKLHEKYQKPPELTCSVYSNFYFLQIEEQPEQCRVSGDSVKDRRPIDPAPIVKLTVFDPNLQQIELADSPFYVVHVSLWSTDTKTKFELVNGARVMIGSFVSSSSLLKDLNDEEGHYFAFPDLSIRLAGRYRLQFNLIHLTRNEVISSTFSDPFIVYPAKSYPGMKESSELSKHLAKQGLKLTIRKQSRFKK